jgi:hypothetical protein
VKIADLGKIMRILSKSSVVAVALGVTALMGSVGVRSQTITPGAPSIALRNGESTELGELYWVSNCRSLLKNTPEAEILDGPPGLSVSVKQAMVLPRFQNCANKVPGGTLVVSAKDIDDASVTRITVRITYRTKDGDRQRSQIYNLSLLP